MSSKRERACYSQGIVELPKEKFYQRGACKTEYRNDGTWTLRTPSHGHPVEINSEKMRIAFDLRSPLNQFRHIPIRPHKPAFQECCLRRGKPYNEMTGKLDYCTASAPLSQEFHPPALTRIITLFPEQRVHLRQQSARLNIHHMEARILSGDVVENFHSS